MKTKTEETPQHNRLSTREEAIKRALAFVFEVYVNTYGSEFKAPNRLEIQKKHKCNSMYWNILDKLGIIESGEKKPGKPVPIRWVGGLPDRKMAEQLVEEGHRYWKEMEAKKQYKKKAPTVASKENAGGLLLPQTPSEQANAARERALRMESALNEVNRKLDTLLNNLGVKL